MGVMPLNDAWVKTYSDQQLADATKAAKPANFYDNQYGYTNNAILFGEQSGRVQSKQAQIFASTRNALATTGNNDRKPVAAYTTQARPSTISGLPAAAQTFGQSQTNTNQMGGPIGAAFKTLLGS